MKKRNLYSSLFEQDLSPPQDQRMKRQENQLNFPTVPLFNQRKRSRSPLTSAPPVNESFNFNGFMNNSSSTFSFNKRPGSLGFYKTPESEMRVEQKQDVQSFQPQTHYNLPVNQMKQYAPLPHPYKAGNMSLKMEQNNPPVRQMESEAALNSKFNKYQPSWSSLSGPPQMSRPSSCKPLQASYRFSQQSPHQPPPPQSPRRAALHSGQQQQSNAWNFTNSFGPQPPMLEEKKGAKPSPNFQAKASPKYQIKSANSVSLRILTAVIDGMRHWSQFRDRVPLLFELFATLDSAVTLGPHGAKNFLMRDGKEVIQCVYYENEKELPRLIRGQAHRCVGNYDRSRNVLVCVSIRPVLPSELRNAQEAVGVCDAEMRVLVKTFSEV